MSNSRSTQATINDSYWQEISSFFNPSYLPDYFKALSREIRIAGSFHNFCMHPDHASNVPDSKIANFRDFQLVKHELDKLASDTVSDTTISSQTIASVLRFATITTIALVIANYNLGSQQKQHIGTSLALLEFIQHVVNNNKHFIQNIYLPFLYRNNIQYLYRQVGFLPLARWLESQANTYGSAFDILNHQKRYQLTRRAAELDTVSHSVFTQSNTAKPSNPSWIGVILTAGILLFSVIITARLFPKTDNDIGTNYYLKWLLTKLLLQVCLLNRGYQEQKQPPKTPLTILQEQAEALDVISTQHLTLADKAQSNDNAELNTSIDALIARKKQKNRNSDAGSGDEKQMLEAQIHSFEDLIQSIQQRDDEALLRYVGELKGLLEELNEPSPLQQLSLCVIQVFNIEQQYNNDKLSLDAIEVLSGYIGDLKDFAGNASQLDPITDELVRVEDNYREKLVPLKHP